MANDSARAPPMLPRAAIRRPGSFPPRGSVGDGCTVPASSPRDCEQMASARPSAGPEQEFLRPAYAA